MKFMPARYSAFDLFDDVLSTPLFTGNSLMKTDITAKDGKYVLDIDLPGLKKEEIKIALHNGMLTVSAARNEASEEKDDQGNIITQERFSGSCSRSYYVGEEITEEDVKAAFNNGVLTISVPDAKTKQAEETKYITLN